MHFRLPIGFELSFNRPEGMKRVPTPSSDVGLSPITYCSGT